MDFLDPEQPPTLAAVNSSGTRKSYRMSFISSSTSSLSRFSAGIGRMKTLLIVYHSRTGGTRQMAEAAATGAAAEPGVDVRLL